MQMITVSGFKGGTGKTTIASLLAVGACIDCEPPAKEGERA
jgi:MinD-like ATPase involved in chromosome partitioning or flagellar assembly